MLGFLLGSISAFNQKAIDLVSAPGKTTATCQWSALDARPAGKEAKTGTPIYSIKGSPYGMNGTITILKFPKPPTNRQLNLSISFKGSKPSGSYSIVCVATSKPKKGTSFNWVQEWQDQGKLDAQTWQTVKKTYVVHPDVVRLMVMVHNTGTNPISFTNAHLVTGTLATPDKAAIARAIQTGKEYEEEKLHPGDSFVQKNHDKLAKQVGPVVIHVVQRAPIMTKKPGEDGTITFPIPSHDASQVPIAFRLKCNEPGKLLGFKWRRLDNGNLVCDAKVEPGTKGSWIVAESLVLVHNGPAPTARGADPHASSTACVQSADPRITEVAKKLAEGTTTDEEYAEKVYKYVLANRGLGKPFVQLDAVAALDCGGSCTNQANLSAALLRAHGLPARTVAHMPTWCGKLYEHWLTEYWTGSEWTAFDASLGRMHPDRRTRVEFGYASTEDENRAFEKLHLRFVMPGAPYQSVVELTPTLFPAELAADDAINWAEQVSLLPAASESALVARAEAIFAQLFGSCSKGEMNFYRFQEVWSAAKKKSLDGVF